MSESQKITPKHCWWKVLVLLGLLICIAVAVNPQIIRARNKPVRSSYSCINCLRQIDGAKQQWALENHKDTNAIPTIADVAQYLKNNKLPVCPGKGKYTIGRVGEAPICSNPQHRIPLP
jgi:hypothetical protein